MAAVTASENNTDAMPRVLAALVFAAERHNGQRRRDRAGSPHLKHVTQVVELLTRAGVTEPDTLVAACIHDVLRDTPADEAEVREHFGECVTDIVDELTEDPDMSRLDRREQLPRLVTEYHGPARLIKLAEKISKLHDLAHESPIGWSRQRRRSYYDWVEEVTAPLKGDNEVLDALLEEALANRP